MARKIVLQVQGQRNHVARGRHLTRMRQARRILEGRMDHAKPARLIAHALGKVGLGAGDVFGDRDGHVVRRLCDERLDGVDQRDFAARWEAQLGWGHRGGRL
jgi:hypothetical protein